MLFNITAECVQVACLLASYFSRSCFELLLSIPESELPHEVWLEFHQSIQVSVLNSFFLICFFFLRKKKAAVVLLFSAFPLNSTCPALLLSRQQEFEWQKTNCNNSIGSLRPNSRFIMTQSMATAARGP